MLLKGKTALITGGGTGIGRATARRFGEEGANVWIIGRKEETLREAAAHAGANCRHTICDVSDADSVEQLIEKLDRLDIVISNAGVNFPTRVEDSSDEWRKLAEINQWGALHTCLAAGKRMVREKTPGRIIIVTSVHGNISEPESGAYGMCKAALNQLARQLAVEWAEAGILVNAVAPGFVVTPMSFVSGENECESEWFKRHFVHEERSRIPLKRPAQPAEIAEAILFFANPRNTYCTGQVLTIDGGMTIKL